MPSLADALRALEAENASVLSEPATTHKGRRAVICDPEGHKVELVELD